MFFCGNVKIRLHACDFDLGTSFEGIAKSLQLQVVFVPDRVAESLHDGRLCQPEHSGN
jgi:hypothetical protein